MTPEETQHYVHLGIEAAVKTSAAKVHMSIKEMERALQEAGGQVYTSARFAPQVSALREALDAFEHAITTKEKQFAPVGDRGSSGASGDHETRGDTVVLLRPAQEGAGVVDHDAGIRGIPGPTMAPEDQHMAAQQGHAADGPQ